MAQLPLDEAVERFQQNEERIDKFVNDPTGYNSTGGTPVESIPAFLERVEQEIDQTVGNISSNVAAAQTARARAEAARAGAEAARDASALNGRVYATTAAGIAATTNGQFFSVPSAVNTEFLTLYKNNSGVAEALQTYPSVNIVQQVLDYFVNADADHAVEFLDPQGAYSVAITKLGEFLAKRGFFHYLRINELVIDADNDLVQSGDNLLAIQDALGNTVFLLKKDGTIQMRPLEDLQDQIDVLSAQVGAGTNVASLTRQAWAALAFATEVNGSVNVIGDSISVGVGASNQATTSWWGRLKSAILGANGENLGGSTSVPHLTFYNNAVSGVTSSYFNNNTRLSAITTQGGVGLYIVAIGTNNIYNSGAHTLPSVYESDLNAIVTYLQAANAANRVMIVVPPVANETTWAPYQDHSKYAAAARRVARTKGCLICDDRGTEMVAAGFYGDGVHPNDAGHEALFLNRLKAITNL